MRIITFNMHAGVGTDRQYNIERVCDLLQSMSPDIVGLNEVDAIFHQRSHYEDSIKVLAESLQMHHAFGPALYRDPYQNIDKGAYGNALLSRYPILDSALYQLYRPSRGESRVLLHVRVNADGEEIGIGVSHLSLLERTRRRQVQDIMDVLNPEKPTILVGDMNAKLHHPSMARLRERYKDSWLEAGVGNGYTYPSRRPRKRIDYIYASHHFQINEAKVLAGAGQASDHLPFMADVSWSEKGLH